jgi:hypothetical protein
MKTVIIFPYVELDDKAAYFLKNAKVDNASFVYKLEEAKEADRYIIVCPDCYGPFLPLWYREERNWVDILNSLIHDNVKLAGTRLNEGFLYDVVVMDEEFFNLAKSHNVLRERDYTALTTLAKRNYSIDYLFKGESPHPYESIFLRNVPSIYLKKHREPRLTPMSYRRQGDKVAVLYVLHEMNENVHYFLENGYFESPDVDFYFLLNGEINYTFPGKSIVRKNEGQDFAAWRDCLELINEEDYDYFVFLNSTVIGPMLPKYLTRNWIETFCSLFSENIGIVGSTVCVSSHFRKTNTYDWYRYYIQSYVFVLSRNSLKEVKNVFNQNFENMTKVDIIGSGEEKLSHTLIDKGWNIKCLLTSHHQRNFVKSCKRKKYKTFFNPAHIINGYYGVNIHPVEIMFIKNTPKDDIYNTLFRST